VQIPFLGQHEEKNGFDILLSIAEMEVLGKSTDWNRKNIQANTLPLEILK